MTFILILAVDMVKMCTENEVPSYSLYRDSKAIA